MNRFAITFEDLDKLCVSATTSIRQRSHLNIHKEYSDPAQQLFIAIQKASYIRPHRHQISGESLLAVKGKLVYIEFDDDGSITSRTHFGAAHCNTLLIQVPVMQWHTVIALENDCILFEVKNGPYIPEYAKEQACWAPEEGTTESIEYLRSLRERIEIINHNL